MAVQVVEEADSLHKTFPYDEFYNWSDRDKYSMYQLLMNNSEWVTGSKESFNSKVPWFKTFYKTKANFFEVNEKDFFLALNPVLQQNQAKETGNDEHVFLNSKGFTLRGLIGKHLGFSTYVTDNQERGPVYFQDRVTATGYYAVPGAGYYKDFKTTAFDYFDARASFAFDFWKYFTIQFGYDKNFIGNGYRSLILSDYSAPYLFLKLNTRIWKINYQDIFMELINQHQPGDYQYPKKYAVVHHLSFNATKWLNVGMYDNVVFSRADHFDFSYLNPIIFLAAAQQQNGSPDKTTIGLDFKANIGHVTQLYGQFVINEFVLHEVLNYKDGWWGNKQGLQLGFKYIDVFNIKNFDLQLEANLVRPFTYSHNDSVSNYSNYNQPLAHPLGANFSEFIAIARFQPANKWNVEAKLIYFRQGLDSGGVNYGGNIFLNYDTRPYDYGYKIPAGVPANCVNLSTLVSWEPKENLFIDLSALYRTYTTNGLTKETRSSTTFTIGLRMNMFRRQYDY